MAAGKTSRHARTACVRACVCACALPTPAGYGRVMEGAAACSPSPLQITASHRSTAACHSARAKSMHESRCKLVRPRRLARLCSIVTLVSGGQLIEADLRIASPLISKPCPLADGSPSMKRQASCQAERCSCCVCAAQAGLRAFLATGVSRGSNRIHGCAIHGTFQHGFVTCPLPHLTLPPPPLASPSSLMIVLRASVLRASAHTPTPTWLHCSQHGCTGCFRSISAFRTNTLVR